MNISEGTFKNTLEICISVRNVTTRSIVLFKSKYNIFISIVSGREERKVGDKPKEFLAVACTSDELNKFRVEYEKCHQKAVGMIEEQRPLGDDISESRYD